MYTLNGVEFDGEPEDYTELKEVVKAVPLERYKLLLTFNDGEKRVWDFEAYIDKPVFRPLKDKAEFDKVYVDYGSPVWRGGEIDFDPCTIYSHGISI